MEMYWATLHLSGPPLFGGGGIDPCDISAIIKSSVAQPVDPNSGGSFNFVTGASSNGTVFNSTLGPLPSVYMNGAPSSGTDAGATIDAALSGSSNTSGAPNNLPVNPPSTPPNVYLQPIGSIGYAVAPVISDGLDGGQQAAIKGQLTGGALTLAAAGAVVTGGAVTAGFTANGVPVFYSGYTAAQATQIATQYGGYTLAATPVGAWLNQALQNYSGPLATPIWAGASTLYATASALTSQAAYYITTGSSQAYFWLTYEQPILDKLGTTVTNPTTGTVITKIIDNGPVI
jgi:hypothetical protein